MATAILTSAPCAVVRLTCARTFGWAWVEVVLAAWGAVLEGLLSSPLPRTMTSTTAMARGGGARPGEGGGGEAPADGLGAAPARDARARGRGRGEGGGGVLGLVIGLV